MRTINCDRCGNEVKPEHVYVVTIKDKEFDLDINCAAEVQSFIEGSDV